MELSIIGAGRTGRTLGRLARRAGYRVGPVICRSVASARRAARFIGAGHPGTRPQGAELTLIAVPDSEIAGVAAALWLPAGAVAAHTCASLGAEALRPLRPAGAIHPLRNFADPARAAELFPGTACAIDGDPAAVRVLSAFARAIGGTPIRVKSDRKALYHAGAVFASNYLVVILDAAVRLLGLAGVERRAALGALLRLSEGTLANVKGSGLSAALTGPVERGDAATVRRHLAAIRERAPEVDDAYRVLGRLAAGMAGSKGSLGRGAARAVREALGAPRGRRR